MPYKVACKRATTVEESRQESAFNPTRAIESGDVANEATIRRRQTTKLTLSVGNSVGQEMASHRSDSCCLEGI